MEMNRNVLAVAGLITIVALVAVALTFNFQNASANNTAMEKNAMVKDSVMIKQDAMIKDVMVQNESIRKDVMTKDTMSKYDGVVLAGKESLLLDFNKEDYELAVSEGKFIVLYFYANWCPTCRAEFPVMQSAFNELKRNDVIGFRVNYNDDQTDDFEKSLASQFGVAYQHTKVILKGNTRLSKSPETWSKEKYLEAISTLN